MKRLLGILALCSATWITACSNGTTPPGDDAGMESGTPIHTDPNTLPDGTPNPCLGATTCMECTSRTPCGFCNGECKAGTRERSFDGTCSGDAWIWEGPICNGGNQNCVTHTDCTSCAEDPNGCGWCSNTGACSAGGRSGPGPFVQGCSRDEGTWVYNTNQMMCP